MSRITKSARSPSASRRRSPRPARSASRSASAAAPAPPVPPSLRWAPTPAATSSASPAPASGTPSQRRGRTRAAQGPVGTAPTCTVTSARHLDERHDLERRSAHAHDPDHAGRRGSRGSPPASRPSSCFHDKAVTATTSGGPSPPYTYAKARSPPRPRRPVHAGFRPDLRRPEGDPRREARRQEQVRASSRRPTGGSSRAPPSPSAAVPGDHAVTAAGASLVLSITPARLEGAQTIVVKTPGFTDYKIFASWLSP